MKTTDSGSATIPRIYLFLLSFSYGVPAYAQSAVQKLYAEIGIDTGTVFAIFIVAIGALALWPGFQRK